MCSTPKKEGGYTLMPVSPTEETTKMEGLSQDGETEEEQESKEKGKKRNRKVKRKRKRKRVRTRKNEAAKGGRRRGGSHRKNSREWRGKSMGERTARTAVGASTA